MLAPVLARLDGIPGVLTSRADSSGRFFWLSLEDGADATSVAAQAGGVLGEGARPLQEAEARTQLAAHRKGDPWLAADEVITLSFVESRLLSVRIAGEVARQVGADRLQREVIAEAIRLALFAAMERVHAEGGRSSSGWIYEEWPAIAAAAVERCAAAASPAVRRQLAEVLPTLLTR